MGIIQRLRNAKLIVCEISLDIYDQLSYQPLSAKRTPPTDAGHGCTHTDPYGHRRVTEART